MIAYLCPVICNKSGVTQCIMLHFEPWPGQNYCQYLSVHPVDMLLLGMQGAYMLMVPTYAHSHQNQSFFLRCSRTTALDCEDSIQCDNYLTPCVPNVASCGWASLGLYKVQGVLIAKYKVDTPYCCLFRYHHSLCPGVTL